MGGKAILAVGALLTAGAALAFTPTHLVIADSTPLYEKGHPFEEAHVLTTLDYWTGVVTISAEPVLMREESQRGAYYFATIENGTEGVINAFDIGLAWIVVQENASVYETGCPAEPIGTLKKGELVAERIVAFPGIQYLLPIRTEKKVDGWVDYDAVEPTYVFPTPTYKKYGEPQDGPPQHAGKEK
jgi:hypothetical protein